MGRLVVRGTVGGAGRVTGTVVIATVSTDAVDLFGATLHRKKWLQAQSII